MSAAELSVDDVSAAGAAEVSAAGVAFDESVGAVLFSVLAGSVVAGAALVSLGMVCAVPVVGVVLVSVDCATAAPMPASRAAAAATADNFF